MLASLTPSFPSATRSSPPLTPESSPPLESRRPSPIFSDESSLFDLSFAYEENSQGEVVRISKGSRHSKSPTPPTPSDSPPPSANAPSPKISSPGPAANFGRPVPLARSESLPSSSFEPTPASASTVRGFQRVTSGPVSMAQTPGASSSVSRSSLLSTGTARKIGGARRVKLGEEPQGSDDLLRVSTATGDEKENLRNGTPLSSNAYSRPVIQIRTARGLPRKGEIDKIIEEHAAEDGEPVGDPWLYPNRNRPRRSASLSDAAGAVPMPEVAYEQPPSYDPPLQQHLLRPGTSLGLTNRGARRVTLEEKLRQEREMAREEGFALGQRIAEENFEAERRAQASRQSPSPPHTGACPPVRDPRPYGHQRKDSDTLRSAGLMPSGSPTAVDGLAPRISPSTGGYSSQGSAASAALLSNRHRRSPTAPEAPTNNDMTPPESAAPSGIGKTWAAGDGREREDGYGEVPSRRSAPASAPAQSHAPPLSKHPILQQQQAQAPDVRSRNMVVNKKAYARLDLIGKGGSSRVYRVMNGANEIFAIKRVSLDKTDADTMSGYMNEIALLKRLEGNSRIIRLLDSEVKPGPGGSKGHLMLVMECGEIDLARLLQEQQKEPLDLVWISYYWKQMLQAVHVIHEEKIVHSDLKPANFVLVRGQLKLIDFGIANAIANDTTNIQRDHQIGTVNYMSPEAIELPEGMRRLKVGRQSDVWSLGCILYQMVYGQPPFQHLNVYQKMKAIPDESHVIEFPEYSTPSIPASRSSTSGGDSSPSRSEKLDHLRVRVPENVIASIRSCLMRNPKERATIPQLLEHDWLNMRESASAPPPVPAPPPPPPPAPALRDDETVINPHFMMQLLKYGISLGQGRQHMDDDQLLHEADRLVQELKRVNAQ